MRKVIAVRCKSPTKAMELIKEPLAPNDAVEFERRAMEARTDVSAIKFDEVIIYEYINAYKSSLKSSQNFSHQNFSQILSSYVDDPTYKVLFSKLYPLYKLDRDEASVKQELTQIIKDTRNEIWIEKIKEIGKDFIEISSAGTVNYDWHKLKRHPKKPSKSEIKNYGAFIHAIESREMEDGLLLLTVSNDRNGYGKHSKPHYQCNADSALSNPNSEMVVTFTHPPYYSVAIIGNKHYPIHAILTRKSKRVLGLLERDIPQYSINWINEALGRLIQ